MSNPTATEEKKRKTRTPRQKPIEIQNQPTGILEESQDQRTERFKKLERALIESVATIVGVPMMLASLAHNEKIDLDVMILDNSLPGIVHNAVGVAMTNKTVERALIAFTQDASVFGLVMSIALPVLLIGMNHANIVPTGILGDVLAKLAAGPTPDNNGADRQRENVLSR